jgi:hypothetical protein
VGFRGPSVFTRRTQNSITRVKVPALREHWNSCAAGKPHPCNSSRPGTYCVPLGMGAIKSYNTGAARQREEPLKEVAIWVLLSAGCFAQSARQYYNELYKAGGLDRMADGDVCFDDDEKLPTFFIFAESKTLREFMIADGTFGKLSKEFQKKLKEDFLIVRGYDKGVVVGAEDFYEKNADSWLGDKFVLSKQPKSFGRMRLNVTWETLRYKRSLEILNPDMSFKDEVSRYGKCEVVAPQVSQHGNP